MANKKKTNQEDLRSLDEKVLAERLAELKMQLKKNKNWMLKLIES